MTADIWIQGAIGMVSAAGGVVAARASRRTKRQEKRDDFSLIARELRTSIRELKTDLALQKKETAEHRQQLTEQDFVIRYMVGWVRSLVTYTRKSGLEPPPPPQPVPDEVRPYMHDVGV